MKSRCKVITVLQHQRGAMQKILTDCFHYRVKICRFVLSLLWYQLTSPPGRVTWPRLGCEDGVGGCLNENHMEGGEREREKNRTREQLRLQDQNQDCRPLTAQSSQHVWVHQKKKLQQTTPGEPHQVSWARFWSWHDRVIYGPWSNLVVWNRIPVITGSTGSTVNIKVFRFQGHGNRWCIDAQSSFDFELIS